MDSEVSRKSARRFRFLDILTAWLVFFAAAVPGAASAQQSTVTKTLTAAYSSNGLDWTKTNTVAIDAGSPGALVVGQKILLYYLGAARPAANETGLFVKEFSADGVPVGPDKKITLSAPNDYLKRFSPQDPAVIRLNDGSYRMYYYEYPHSVAAEYGDSLHRPDTDYFNIRIATSTDGVAFTLDIDPAHGFQYPKVMDPSVVRTPDGKWRLFFSYSLSTGYKALTVVSDDGLDFRCKGVTTGKNFCANNITVLDIPNPVTGKAAWVPCAMSLPAGGYRLYYHSNEDEKPSVRIYSAYSADGRTWTSEQGTRIAPGATMAAIYANGMYRMFYAGAGNGGSTGPGDDECPEDPEKTAPGTCGCGVSDADSDGDGTPDCRDECPADRGKVSSGNCGCGVSDADSDGDGTADCRDECPADRGKITPGLCGCGGSEDADANGIADCGGAGNPGSGEGAVPGEADGSQLNNARLLPPHACVGANGFLSQVNIASVINLLQSDLHVTLKYLDQQGVVRGTAQATLATKSKFDFIVNDLGLKPDTYGTVCVDADAATDGAWSGGITVYKPDLRSGGAEFGSAFDFALYYPFRRPWRGPIAVPLNTFHIGTDPLSTVANWIAISDAAPGDGEGLNGLLRYYNSHGETAGEARVSLPDGGRADFAGHVAIGGADNRDAVGLAEFLPAPRTDGEPSNYYLHVTRYFYDCLGSSCSNFLTAFNMPAPTAGARSSISGVSTADGEVSVVELTNAGGSDTTADLRVYNDRGNLQGSLSAVISRKASQHYVMIRNGETGFIDAGESASAVAESESSSLNAVTVFYKLEDSGRLLHAYAAPFMDDTSQRQTSQFNTFIKHRCIPEIYNKTERTITASLDFIAVGGARVFEGQVEVPAHGTTRLDSLALAANTYGIVRMNADEEGLVLRSYIRRANTYTLALPSD